ncbi:methyltransferase [Ktedonobacter sp. SOSP1-85]|uniref:hypothetical protein n=1 Tax=Ktedonobacter sp. SOSP1-85 TaxID=2778367 RepID=UPI001915C450|nr:hypothetical protein [Ktedonobacter sp. SOSP1-85]GHO79077.1 methyltransferase [Ktedonobacter sp. SOSP1-85]
MRDSDTQALYDYLVSEYNHHFDYWDWSYLDGRRVDVSTQPKAWDYIRAVQTAMQQTQSILDMRTGGGEKFAELLKQYPIPHAYATEGYAPNLAMAHRLLDPLGATVYAVDDETLPFADNMLELIINRHGSYDPREVLRVLKPGQRFITQQVGDQANVLIHELLGRQKELLSYEGTPHKPAWNLEYATHELRAHGWQIIEQHEHFHITRFLDLGAFVYYLKAIPWEVPNFSINAYFDKLVEIQRIFERDGMLDIPFHTFFIVARKV